MCRAYARHYRDRAQAVIQFRGAGRMLGRRHSRALFDHLTAERPSRRAIAGILAAALPGAAREGDGRLYLNVGHTGLERAGYRRWLARANVRPIYLLHDLIPITHPQFCRPGEATRHAARVEAMLTTGRGIIANSRATLDALKEWAGDRTIPPALVAWLGHDVPTDRSATPLMPAPYFVTLGTIEGRKNHLLLLRLWRRLALELGTAAPRLLVIGQRGWEAAPALAMLDRATAGDAIVHLAGCDDATLARHLRHAQALLFPSHAEGFGLPLIEALAAGTPVMASDLPVFAEIAGDAVRYLDPDDSEGWWRAVRDHAATPVDLVARDAAAAAYRVPTHAAHFARVDAWLAQLR